MGVRKEALLSACFGLVLVLSIFVGRVGVVSGSPGTRVFVNPAYNVDVSKTSGTTFQVTVQVAEVTDLYTYEFYLKWYGAALNSTTVAKGPFLESGGYTSSFTQKQYNIPDPKGDVNYLYVAQGLLAAPTGVTGSGVLVTITFLVEMNNIESGLDLYGTGKFLSSFGQVITLATEDGYFANITWAARGYPGDVDKTVPRDVDIYDLGIVARAMGTDPSWPSGTDWGEWNSIADLNTDLKVDIFDLFIVGRNYGQPK